MRASKQSACLPRMPSSITSAASLPAGARTCSARPDPTRPSSRKSNFRSFPRPSANPPSAAPALDPNSSCTTVLSAPVEKRARTPAKEMEVPPWSAPSKARTNTTIRSGSLPGASAVGRTKFLECTPTWHTSGTGSTSRCIRAKSTRKVTLRNQ
uniref:(northern house mosquito) hypothetical protein n=1 Tax=Culex pipiens TaxID=7175 RepID=A0A8D8FV65_CULPI